MDNTRLALDSSLGRKKIKSKISKGSKVFDVINTIIMFLIILITLYPFIYIISISLSDSIYVRANMITFFPRGTNLDSYRQVFDTPIFWNAYLNTVIYTVVGTAINIAATCALAFCLTRRELLFRKTITFMVIATMYIGGGMVPTFMVVRDLGMYNTLWAMVVPGAISTFNMILVRTYMQGIGEEMLESARIDGANELGIFARIVVPVSKPVIATVGLFYAVGHWNNYFTPLIYLRDAERYPLQLLLMNMIVNNDMSGMGQGARDAIQAGRTNFPTSNMMIAASMVIAMVPILCVYPFIQKYFVKGIMIGSLKG